MRKNINKFYKEINCIEIYLEPFSDFEKKMEKRNGSTKNETFGLINNL